jgi:predicted acylesterase/phospholipase RssA
VYLGNIDLLEWYNLDLGVRILHMLLMSWGGEAADEDEAVKGMAGMQEEIQRTVAEVRRAGVDQMDVRSPNLLWNREAQRVMLIDFERAHAAKKRAMQEISPNKRRKPFKSSMRRTRRKASLV